MVAQSSKSSKKKQHQANTIIGMYSIKHINQPTLLLIIGTRKLGIKHNTNQHYNKLGTTYSKTKPIANHSSAVHSKDYL